MKVTQSMACGILICTNCVCGAGNGLGNASPAAPSAEPPIGDCAPRINEVFPEDVFYHNGQGGHVLDVTQPPFNAKGDGVTDDTQALIRAMDFVRDHYDFVCSEDYAYPQYKLNRNWVIYLPNGNYLVSDTISRSWPALAYDIANGWSNVTQHRIEAPEDETPELKLRGEDNWGIRILGQSRDGTVLRLKDGCPGFGAGQAKPVLCYYLLAVGSSVNIGNFIENLTIDTGAHNPGAVGLKWNNSNYGGIYNLAIRSGDGSGRAGLMMDKRNAHGYQRNLLIDGFDTGIDLSAPNGPVSVVVLENATLRNQRNAGVRVTGGAVLCGRKLLVQDAPVGLKIERYSHAVIIESDFRSAHADGTAISLEKAHLFARDVGISGYPAAVAKDSETVLNGSRISEYVSDTPLATRQGVKPQSMYLPVADTPEVLPEADLTQWASVDDFGAAGDGIADDTAAIQRAMYSGKPVVYFPKANYVVNGTVDIPATVREVTWLFGAVHRSKAAESAMFRVSEPSSQPLLLHRNVNAGAVFLDHDADRPVVLEDLHTWFHHVRRWARGPDMLFPSAAAQDAPNWRLYRNATPDGPPKTVFVNNTLGFAPGGEGAECAVENVRAWVRQTNVEHFPVNTAFRHSTAWIFGFKTEYGTHPSTIFHVTDHSRLEVLGGLYLQRPQTLTSETPVVYSRDSQVSLVMGAVGSVDLTYAAILEDECNGQILRMPTDRFPVRRGRNETIVPLLVNDSGE